MEPTADAFPVLYYVISRASKQPSFKNVWTEFLADVDGEATESESPNSNEDEQVELVERMPRLNGPALLASMTDAVSDVARARSVLESLGCLGDRPDHDTVESTRARLAEVEGDFVRQLDGLRHCGPEPIQWPKEREKVYLRAVIKLDDLHEGYQRLLRDAEERLVKMYEAGGGEQGKEGSSLGRGEQEAANEQVMAILQQESNEHLETVDLSNHQLKHLPEAFGRLRSLVSLNLSHNQLSAIPDTISGLECLEELQLSSNFLTSLPDYLEQLSSLKILNVSANKLKFLPDNISKCRSLVELDVSYNELAYLPTNIGHELQKLEKLYIKLNKIRTLPSTICEMRSLRLLDAHFNVLRGLPDEFGKLTSLETLDLGSNFTDLRELPASFGDLVSLKELDLSNNQIHELPDTFGGLQKLIKLNLDQNPLAVPPSDVVAEGVEAVREFMARRWDDMSAHGERKRLAEGSTQPQNGWFSRGTTWINTMVSGVPGNDNQTYAYTIIGLQH